MNFCIHIFKTRPQNKQQNFKNREDAMQVSWHTSNLYFIYLYQFVALASISCRLSHQFRYLISGVPHRLDKFATLAASSSIINHNLLQTN